MAFNLFNPTCLFYLNILASCIDGMWLCKGVKGEWGSTQSLNVDNPKSVKYLVTKEPEPCISKSGASGSTRNMLRPLVDKNHYDREKDMEKSLRVKMNNL